jgi:DNA primase
MLEMTSEHIKNWVAKHFEYKSNDKQIRICNPADPDDKEFKLYISLRKTKSRRSEKTNFWVHDFRPNHGCYDGSFLNFVAKYKQITFKQAVREVVGARSFLIKKDKEEDKEETITLREMKGLSLPEGAIRIDGSDDPIQKMALVFLKKRGFSTIDAMKYDLHYTIGSIIFIYREFGRVVHWQQRSLLGKTFNFPDASKKGDHLFGYDLCNDNSPIGITEAAFGAMALGPGVTASGGASLTENIVKLLRKKNPSRIILTPDNDKAGIKSLKSNWKILIKHFDNIYYCLPPKMPEKKDWNDAMLLFGRDAIRSFYSDHQRLLTIGEISKPRLFPL